MSFFFSPLPVFQSVELQSLWQDQPVVLFFLRRFGCQVCRWMASEISKLEADLRSSGVALVGVGPEEFGLKEFKEGGFFKGCKQEFTVTVIQTGGPFRVCDAVTQQYTIK